MKPLKLDKTLYLVNYVPRAFFLVYSWCVDCKCVCIECCWFVDV